jgi:hypothetical protein
VKHCASCGRDIPESGTVCEPCEKWAAGHVVAPSPPKEVPQPAQAPSPVRSGSVSRRDLLVILAVIAAAGVLTVTLLLMRGAPSASVAAAQKDIV